MKITGVRTRIYETQLSRYLGDANNPGGWRIMSAAIISIDTDEGINGIALAGAGSAGQIRGIVENLLVGKDPRGVRGLWQLMNDEVFKAGNRGTAGDAVSAIDVALWDLKAKANNEPLWKTLGASEPRVRAYASGLDMPLSDDDLRQFYSEMAAKGVAAGKLKVGLNRDDDLRRLSIMHDALATSGKTPELMIDSNEYWSPKQAIAHIRFFERHYELLWAEEPARRWDYRGLRKVSQNVTTAVASGENLDELPEFTDLVANEAVDVINLGAGAGGITGMLQVADLAYAFDLPVTLMNCPANYTAHVAAALPNHIHMEVVGAGREAAMQVDNHIEGGWIILGNTPGLGITFDEAALAPLLVDQASPPPRSGRRVGAALYQVPASPSEMPRRS
jgi:L-alanine-DL-glutamate epimerase-like enolase superfamily enzyme